MPLLSLWREARAAIRLARAACHVAAGMGLVSCVFPLLSEEARLGVIRRWSRDLLAIFRIRLERHGGAPHSGGLLVANHVSWLDICGIMALEPALFVAKAEIRRWPGIGWLASKIGTLFVERASLTQIQAVNSAIARTLAAGRTVTIFPEGTTTDGSRLLQFRSALIAPAVAAGRSVQPLALRYHGPDGQASAAAAYAGDTTMWQSLRNVARQRFLILRIDVMPALGGAGTDRRTLARNAREAIAGRLQCRLDDMARQASGDAVSYARTARGVQAT